MNKNTERSVWCELKLWVVCDCNLCSDSTHFGWCSLTLVCFVNTLCFYTMTLEEWHEIWVWTRRVLLLITKFDPKVLLFLLNVLLDLSHYRWSRLVFLCTKQVEYVSLTFACRQHFVAWTSAVDSLKLCVFLDTSFLWFHFIQLIASHFNNRSF